MLFNMKHCRMPEVRTLAAVVLAIAGRSDANHLGHEWQAPLHNVKRGHWCPHCAGNARLTLSHAQSLAAQRGGACLASCYVSNKLPLRWLCQEGHEWNATYNNVQQGTWCPYCALKARRLCLEDAQDVAIARSGACLSMKYVNNREHLLWRCSKGHRWLASLNLIKDKGSWCPECAVESRRLSRKDGQRAAAARRGACLSYPNASNRWPKGQKHQSDIAMSAARARLSFKDAQGVVCASRGTSLAMDIVNSKRTRAGHARLSLKYAQEMAISRGGWCLSSTYVNCLEHLQWRCREGHEWNACLNSIKNKGTWCPLCAPNMPLSLKDAQELASTRGGACLSAKYVNCVKHLTWKCREGHVWNASLHNIKNKGCWCPHCVKRTRLSLKDAQDLAGQRGGACLSSEYVNNGEHLRWRCEKGHEWLATLHCVKNRRSWCPHCAGTARLSLKVAKDVARSRKGTCLSTEYANNKTPLKWRCMKGHEWLACLHNVKNKKSWCPECASGTSEREVRRILEKRIFPGSRFRKCRPKFLTTAKGGRLELDGYCEGLGIAFEYQGEQHYSPKSYFHRGRRCSFENLIARDKLKASRCREAGVQLLIVPYKEKDLEGLMRQLLGMSGNGEASEEAD